MNSATDMHRFKRLVLAVSPGMEARCVEAATEFAALLRVELLGHFLEDADLRNLAGIPFAREFRPLGAGWRPIQPDQLSRDLDLAAHKAKRIFDDAARHLASGSRFETLRGPISETIPAISEATDIVMIVEPLSAAGRIAEQFVSLSEAAFRSAAAVMLSPSRIARMSGPIVAIAATPEDISIRAAEEIAKAAGEELIILKAPEEHQYDHLLTRSLLHAPPSYMNAPERITERLIIMSRTAAAERLASVTAAARGIPILVLELENSIKEAEAEL